jgi:hypothetical protein
VRLLCHPLLFLALGPMREGLFACVCSRSVADSDADWASYEPELEKQLRELNPGSQSSRVIISSSAGLAVQDSGPAGVATLAQDGCLAAFVGYISLPCVICDSYGEE